MIRNLAQDPSEEVRRRAYEAELKAWESVREPVAFALNGVKGSAITLAQRRGFRDVLHMSLEQNRMDAETPRSAPRFDPGQPPGLPPLPRGQGAPAWAERRSPGGTCWRRSGTVQLQYTWPETQDFIVDQFGSFSGELADFARRAFDERWIDAEPRDGKRGGAFCMGVPGVEESRILCNFDGSFDQLTTVAHELGHGFHNWCQRGLPMLKRGAPMTLAETASIFCETIVFNAALESAPADARVAILENQLLGATQVCVDIYSRVLFESEVLKRRAQAELSADEFCELMLEAQKQAYGDVLDPDHLHPYMWLMKPHYYQVDRNFYNYPVRLRPALRPRHVRALPAGGERLRAAVRRAAPQHRRRAGGGSGRPLRHRRPLARLLDGEPADHRGAGGPVRGGGLRQRADPSHRRHRVPAPAGSGCSG